MHIFYANFWELFVIKFLFRVEIDDAEGVAWTPLFRHLLLNIIHPQFKLNNDRYKTKTQFLLYVTSTVYSADEKIQIVELDWKHRERHNTLAFPEDHHQVHRKYKNI